MSRAPCVELLPDPLPGDLGRRGRLPRACQLAADRQGLKMGAPSEEDLATLLAETNFTAKEIKGFYTFGPGDRLDRADFMRCVDLPDL